MMPEIAPLKTAKECSDTLTNLYEKKAPSQKRVLKNRLRTLKMEKDDRVASFFTKISQIRDQLLVIGVPVDDDDLLQTVVDGLPPAWEVFMSGINARETRPNFERLWHDCLQEEGRIQCKTGSSKEDNIALTARTKKGKRFPSRKKLSIQKEKDSGGYKDKDFDISRVRCFNCQKKAHFARNSSKSRKGHKDKFYVVVAAKEERTYRRKPREVSSDQKTRKEYYPFSALIGTVTDSAKS
jgi:hypothetical protein